MIATLAQNAKAWPFEQARLLLKRLDKLGRSSGPVVFETGYGPSGLPHLGTFGEVVRTTMVLQAFEALTDGLMLRDRPGVFCAGEMLDWEAPTGGYLITTSMATGRWAGRHAVEFAKETTPANLLPGRQ